MWRKTPDIIKTAARELRKNMTFSEEKIWKMLKNEKIWFRINRQSPIYVFTEESWLDRYIIADFYCPEKQLVIEIDGDIHDVEDIFSLDREKEKILTQAWYRIVRFKNEEVEINLSEVIKRIQEL
jgi:very-short-patch-repair endonuclease